MAESHNPGGSVAALEAHVAKLRERYAEVEKIFDGFPISPLKSTDFRKFLEDHVSEIAMSYIVLGKFELHGTDSAMTDDATARATAKGFAVSGQPAAPAEALDPALANNPAARAAIAAGLDLDRDHDDNDLRPRRPSES